MALSAGTRLGPYEIVTSLGVGGMGEVYKATDTRLNRTVAIKVMPPHFADDPDMRQRFEREAQTIAGLSHPNICMLHDVGDAPSSDPDAPAVKFLVMEFLEGQTLAERLGAGRERTSSSASGASGAALNVDEALRVAIAIADALDKAHRQGIVHRDLKPANVMLSKNGVKLLDFGLAKWTTSREDSLGAMPTRADVTSPGMVLGTLQYMAPEQVEGKEADARTDIFAFGALLHEMVTGRKAFQGKSQATLISAIMTGEPQPLSALQPMAPSALNHVVKRCLAKDPDDRWQDAHSVLVQLQWIARRRTEAEAPAGVSAARASKDRVLRVVFAGLVTLALALAAPAFLYLRGPEPADAFPLRIPIVGFSAADFAISPNGREVAVVAQPDPQETAALYVRPVTAPTFRRLANTDGAAQPFWSPDGRSIAFVADRRLQRVDAAGGAPKNIAPVPDFSGGTWNGASTIVFGSANGLFRVSAEGGSPEPLTTVESPETGHFWPWFLPDGTRYVYLAWSNDPASRAVYVGALGSKERTQLMAAESNVAFALSTDSTETGYAVFHREASLFAQPFDAASLELAGDAVQVAGGLAHSPASGRGSFDVSQTGALAYFQGRGGPSGRGQTNNEQFAWVSRDGGRIRMAVRSDQYGDMDPSPDLKQVALTKLDAGASSADIWIVDSERNNSTRLTLDPADDINPVWSPDGARIAFTSYRNGNADIFVKNANGVGEDTPLTSSPADEFVEAWSRDGRYVAILVQEGPYQDIHALPIGGEDKPFPVVLGPYRKDEPQFSYDGQWLAYTSDESTPGQFEVYVISFPKGDEKLKVSTGGGGQPRWRRDGRELFFRTVGGYVSVAMTLGPKITAGVPTLMFPTPTTGGGNAPSSDPLRHQWAAAPDGQSFLVRVPPIPARAAGAGPNPGRDNTPTAVNNADGQDPGPGTLGRAGRGRGGNRGQGAPALTVIVNWPAMLRKDH